MRFILKRRNFLFRILPVFVILVLSFALVGTAKAAANEYCFCSHNVSKITSDNWKTVSKDVSNSGCVDITTAKKSCDPSSIDSSGKPKYDICKPSSSQTACTDELTKWLNEYKKKMIAVGSYESGVGGITGAFLPACVTQDTLSGECKDVGIFVKLAINIANYLFGIVGALALLMLIYGGVTLILSQGNPEKTKKSYDIISAAVIGLAIVFSAYILISYFGSSVVGIMPSYKLN